MNEVHEYSMQTTYDIVQIVVHIVRKSRLTSEQQPGN